jgi:4-hydroxythreonine-4-phosphate dehydrogenase
VLATLDLALEGLQAGWFDAMVTAPLQKATINDAGVAFPATPNTWPSTPAPQVVMMLAGEPAAVSTDAAAAAAARVALATTHLPCRRCRPRSAWTAWRAR